MRAPIVLALALLLGGCGGDGREDAVAAAETWLEAVGERDADAACALMLPSAVDALRKKSGLNPRTNCLGAVRAYSDAFPDGEVDRILETGLEAEGPVKDGEIGVFPISGERELQVVLMRRDGDAWKVGSTSLGFAETGTPGS